MTDGLGLETRDIAAAVVSPGRASVSRDDLARKAAEVRDRLLAGGQRRVLVCSDDPVDILTTLDATHKVGADLWIAHTNLPASVINDVVEQFGIDLTVSSEVVQERPGKAGAAGSGRVHMMTSGTTGRPKIAAHTLDSILGRVRRHAGHAVNRDGRWLLTYQPTGFAGLQVMLTAVLSGGTLVVPRERTPSGFVEAAATCEVTQISATPTFWRSFLVAAPPGRLDLRQITMGGEGIDQATLDRVMRAFPTARVTHIYASTEAGVVFAVHDGREGFPSVWLEERQQDVELAIREGLLHVRTPHLMRGYVGEVAQPLLSDGWLATQDRCELVGDRVRLLGRQDATINVAGSKVYPLAVETFLLGLPGVVEARVFGVANPISGFLVAADVVLSEGTAVEVARPAIMAACRQGLSAYQVPRVMKFVAAIEVSPSGKKG